MSFLTMCVPFGYKVWGCNVLRKQQEADNEPDTRATIVRALETLEEYGEIPVNGIIIHGKDSRITVTEPREQVSDTLALLDTRFHVVAAYT
jgi:hypothetical protein